MEITKSHWESHDGTLKLGVPIMKVNQERRLVSGFATLDNLDRQGDIVLSSASREAFANFKGNVREMHDKIAAGKVVSFSEKTYYDPDSKKMYEGIWVEVYVSRGAESTWEKVLDGTLTAFSIGAMVLDKEDIWSDDVEAWITIIKAYRLTELSLVDSPANQLSNIFSVLKADGEATEVSGIAVNVETEDVFWCSDDNLATIGEEGCTVCGTAGEKVGWIESNLDPVQKADAIAGLLQNNAAMPAVQKEEGVEKKMADEVTETTSEVAAPIDETNLAVEKSADVSDTAETTAPADATVEASAQVVSEEPKAAETAVVEDIDWKAELAALRETLGTFGTALASVTKSVEALSEGSTETNAKVEALGTTINEAVSKAQGETTEALGAIASRVGDVEKSLVVKKAADREGDAPVTVEKQDIWADRFTVRSF